MAHFAKLDSNNIVTDVVVVNNDVLLDENNNESEQKGLQFLTSLTGHSNWVQTSYNNNTRKKYAGISDTYDSTKDKFIAKQPYASWTLDANDDWQPPVSYPTDGNLYLWNEDDEQWDLAT